MDTSDNDDIGMTLVKHLLFDRILPILPVESTLTTYSQVEQDQFFVSCRSVILNLAISGHFDAVVEEHLNAIDTVLQDEEITSDNITNDALHSILVLLRLLSDVAEFYWEYIEDPTDFAHETMKDFEKQKKKTFSGLLVGFSTHRPGFHKIPPKPIASATASRLIFICNKIKFNSRTLRVLKNMSHSLYGTGTIPSSKILPTYQNFLKKRKFPSYCQKIDVTIDYLLRFSAASNPMEFNKYVKIRVTGPLLISHTLTELGVVKHLDLFGCMFLTNYNLAPFLDTIRLLSGNMKRTIFHSLLLDYASKSIMLWIMARPNEYIQLYRDLNSSKVRSDKVLRLIPQYVNALFEDIYNTFNVSNLLTYAYNDHNVHRNNGIHLSINISNESPVNTGNESNTESSSINSAPISPQVASTNLPLRSFPMSPSQSSNHDVGGQHISPHPLSNDDLSSFNSSKRSVNIDESFDSQNTTDSQGFANDTSTPYLENVLELYANSDESELLTHFSILRFLLTLTLLDTDVYEEMNMTTFKNIPDASRSDGHTSPYSTSGSVGSSSPWESASSSSMNNEKAQMKSITHGFKKFTSLQSNKSTKKRNGMKKFVMMLMKNLSGSQVISDVSLVDSIRTVLSLMTISSSISLLDDEIPSVVFSRRLFRMLGHNLDIGKEWKTATNGSITSCIEKNPIISRKLQLEYFSSGLQLDCNSLLRHLQLDNELKILDLRRLCLYTEGFRVFFHLQSTKQLREKVAIDISIFFKSLFCEIADILLKVFPYFDERVTNLILSILDGTILEKFDKSRTLSKIKKLPVHNPHTSSKATTPQSTSGKNTGETLWDLHSIFPTSQANSTTSSVSDVAEIAETGTPTPNSLKSITPALTHGAQNNQSFPDLVTTPTYNPPGLISPGSTHTNNTRRFPLSPSGESDLMRSGYSLLQGDQNILSSTSPISTTSTGLPMSIKSPRPVHARSRRTSDERLPKFMNKGNMSSADTRLMGPISENDDARKIMMNIFSIFKRMTNFFILPHRENIESTWLSKDFRNVIKPIFVAIIDTNLTLQSTAQSFMDILINYISEFSESSSSPGTINDYYLLCTYTVTLFSAALFDLKLPNSKRELILDIIVKFMNVRQHLAKVTENSNTVDSLRATEKITFPLLTATLGGSLIISLYYNRGDIPRLAKLGYAEFLQAIRFFERNIGEIDLTCIYNIDFVEAMAKDNYAASGSVAFQRRLRNNILKHITRPDSILLETMDIIFKKWNSLSNTKSLTQEELGDFRSLAGILASISGILFPIGEIGREIRDFPYLHEFRMDRYISIQENPLLLAKLFIEPQLTRTKTQPGNFI